MKYKAQNPSGKAKSLQQLLDQQNQVHAALQQTQNKIAKFETTYLEESWQDGNLYLGWTRSLSTGASNNGKIKISAKERIFTLSSVTSKSYGDLNEVADRNLSPYGENRFESKKKKRIKKRNASQMRRPRPIRKKKRR